MNTRLKRLGFVALAVFFILAGIGVALDEDVQNATPREVMGFVGGLLAVLLLVGLYFVFRDTEATKRWWMDFGERHLFLKKNRATPLQVLQNNTPAHSGCFLAPTVNYRCFRVVGH